MAMRPSQYHYIKRMLSRELYRKQLQKKNNKLRKKKLRKKKRKLRKQKRQIRRQEKLLQKQMHPEIYKNAYLRKPYSLKAGDKNLLLLFGTISLGLITILLVIQWLLDVENVFKQIGVLRGMALLAVEIFTFGGPAYLCYHFYKKNKNSDYNQSGSTQNQYREPPKSYNLVDANSNTYKCPSCGNIANPNYHYCIVCGHSLQSIQLPASTSEKEKVKCPHCNKMIDFDCCFCTECGYPLLKPTVEVKKEEYLNKPEPIQEQKDVTEVFKPQTELSDKTGSLNAKPITITNPDYYLEEAAQLFVNKEKGSIGMLQRNFKIGFNRAYRIMEQLYKIGVVGPENENVPREILVTESELNSIFDRIVYENANEPNPVLMSEDVAEVCDSFEPKIEKFVDTVLPNKTEIINPKKETETRNPIINGSFSGNMNFRDAYAALCVASCEFDKEQNYINETTKGNVRYNDERFDNIVDDPLVKELISNQKIKEVSELITRLYSKIGLQVLIDGMTCTKAYVILKLFPMHGTRKNDILTFQNDVEYLLGMNTIMTVSDKNGYIGVVLPVQYFVQQPDENSL